MTNNMYTKSNKMYFIVNDYRLLEYVLLVGMYIFMHKETLTIETYAFFHKGITNKKKGKCQGFLLS